LQLLNNFPAFHGTAFARDLYCSLSSVRPMQSIPSHSNSPRSILKLSILIHPDLPNSLFPPWFFPLSNLYLFLFSPLFATLKCCNGTAFFVVHKLKYIFLLVNITLYVYCAVFSCGVHNFFVLCVCEDYVLYLQIT
jgi:hypothetical protein